MRFRMLAWRYHAEKESLRKRMESAGGGIRSSGNGDSGMGSSRAVNIASSRGNFGAGNAGSPEMAGEGGRPRRTGKPFRAVRTFLRSEAGLGTLEIVLIAAVIIIIVILFRDWIIGFLQDLFDKVENETDSFFS